MSAPSVAELRAVAQPQSTMDRRSGEHWAGLLYMRRLSIYVTWLLAKTPITPNQVTGLMIVCGVAAGAVLALPGLWAALACALLVQLYLLFDCSDGELARWTGRTSVKGVYLDRVGHYFAEAALLIGLGFRAAETAPDWYTVLGFAAALGAILIKAETDLVDVARARSGLAAATEAAAEQFASRSLGLARKIVAALRFHRVIQAVELSLIVVIAALLDPWFPATRVLVVACAVIAGVQLVLHLVSILASRRLS
ncbi:CDP-alcohol phosphatidyltransferase family protein [Thermobispora bispora]|uniref:CDP-alcohol phosphatidyltransferase n=1 Tax=Thermobispora bispora (strain ATCC 19993 / DSM 43833 / CBS 139.67 / JCM 10125 / KCTC 9307 / NBRC 14880 / R51) TaxID=469371 RepID=D6Y5V3_THEBD|nr:CDP-alcohol phosphatidyltransferase family protein [Thermobispora bispora]ADG87449.1 CDP-alcohol phosphatidyltransferase [Thermobispora bispora DSM 43833]MBO2472791.1 transferase [Actinomycetales bacterium]MBX6168151.1 CDP-alcohol phosphatidyltransferase family protein [Thermobispora bispora]MDI9580344.1 CDP-alcohol phosphatidyltransferase family protein [Thermobispora sp.]